MKAHIIDSKTSLRKIINSLSEGIYYIDFDKENFDKIFIRNLLDTSIIIRVFYTDIPKDTCISSLKKLNGKTIDGESIQFVVNTTSDSNHILSLSLIELICKEKENNPFSLDTPCWEIYQEVSDDWIPPIEKSVNDMDIPVDPLSTEEMKVINNNY